MDRIRMGVLGAARIVPGALVAPARLVPEVEVTAIAARDQRRAQAFAQRHGIPRVLGSYDEVVNDPAIDAVYIPLPNSLHHTWTIKALQAGKHVLCEKPLASNALEAEAMAAAAERSGRVLMEAFHYRYHPLAERMRGIAADGTLGRVRHIETWMCFPLPLPRNIRYNLALGGGATMDTGCYAIHMLRLLAGNQPEVTGAWALLAGPEVDRAMTAEFRFEDGRTGRMTCSLWSRDLVHIAAQVTGDAGEMVVVNPAAPQRFNRLTVRTAAGTRVEQASRRPSYQYQLRAFAGAILHGEPILTPPADAVANMRVIDAVYRAAGLRPRGLLED